PPHAAADLAKEVAALRFPGIFVDGNAVSPATAREIGGIVEKAGAPFVDGGIIGPPPVKPGSTRLYLPRPAPQPLPTPPPPPPRRSAGGDRGARRPGRRLGREDGVRVVDQGQLRAPARGVRDGRRRGCPGLARARVENLAARSVGQVRGRREGQREEGVALHRR